MVHISNEKRVAIRVSDKMLKEFEKALEKNEQTKTEVIRGCIREYIKKNK